MTDSAGNLKEGASRVLIAARFSRELSQNWVWRRVRLPDYRGVRRSLKNHAFRLAADNERWESACEAFYAKKSVLNVSLVPADKKFAVCSACEAGLRERNQGEPC